MSWGNGINFDQSYVLGFGDLSFPWHFKMSETIPEGEEHSGLPWPYPELLITPRPSVPWRPPWSPHSWYTVFPIGFLRKLLEKCFWPPWGSAVGRALTSSMTHLWPDCGGWFPGTCCAGASYSPHCTRPGAAPPAGCPGMPGSRCARCAGTPAGSAPSPPGRWPRTWGQGGQVRTHGPFLDECLLGPGRHRCISLSRKGILARASPLSQHHCLVWRHASLWTTKSLFSENGNDTCPANFLGSGK